MILARGMHSSRPAMGLALRIVALLLVALGVPASGAFAQAQSGFSLKPGSADPNVPATQSYFILSAVPGATLRDRVLVTNGAGAPATLELYAVDAVTGQTSGAVFPNRDTPPRGPGSWLKLAQDGVVVPPGATLPVDFELRVPADARPGQYLAGIVAQPPPGAATPQSTTLGSNQGEVQVATTTRVVVAVAVTVPGPVERKITVVGVRSASGPLGTQMVVTVRNDGTVLVKPQGTLRLKDDGGNVRTAIPLRMDTILPGGSADFTVGWPPELPPGDYRADVVLDAIDSLPTGPAAPAGAAQPTAAPSAHAEFSSPPIAVRAVVVETATTGAPGAAGTIVVRREAAGGPPTWWPWGLVALAVLVVVNVAWLRSVRRHPEPPSGARALAAAPAASRAAPAPGSQFVKGRGPTIYLLQDGHKRPLAGWDAFVACGGAPDLGNVRLLPEDQLNALPTGSPIAAPEDARAS